jgi:hypothetical protein
MIEVAPGHAAGARWRYWIDWRKATASAPTAAVSAISWTG